MRMMYNPGRVADKKQAWKCFLTGSLVTSAFIYLIITITATDNIVSFFSCLALIAAGIILFIDTNISYRKEVFIFQNFVFAGLGLVVSLAFHVWGFLLLWLGITAILVLVTWLQKFVAAGKSKAEKKEEKEQHKQ
ncbi:MAG: hypothetical protein NTU57_02275 [Candidatus Aenigmarchaeota archaeon]|nr:hypothetical protein [Candidatus Aenigmarchaeota archaeon]